MGSSHTAHTKTYSHKADLNDDQDVVTCFTAAAISAVTMVVALAVGHEVRSRVIVDTVLGHDVQAMGGCQEGGEGNRVNLVHRIFFNLINLSIF